MTELLSSVYRHRRAVLLDRQAAAQWNVGSELHKDQGQHLVHGQMACSCQAGGKPVMLVLAVGLPMRSCLHLAVSSLTEKHKHAVPSCSPSGAAAWWCALDRAAATCRLMMLSMCCAHPPPALLWQPHVEQHCNALVSRSAPRLTSLTSSMAVPCHCMDSGAPSRRWLPTRARARQWGCQRGARCPT